MMLRAAFARTLAFGGTIAQGGIRIPFLHQCCTKIDHPRAFHKTISKTEYAHALQESQVVHDGDIARCFDDDHRERITTRLANLKRRNLSVTMKRQAAVVVPLCFDNGVPSILFTLRSDLLNTHGGEVSFPGGKKDDTDENITVTAQRECMEEIGVHPSEIIGMWHDVPNKNFTTAVTPVVAFLGDIDVKGLEFNHDEVAEVFTMPVATLMDPSNRTTRLRTADGKPMPAFKGGDHLVWGLTAYVLNGVINTAIYPSSSDND